MATEDVHLDIRGVGKSFGGTRALDDVSLEVRVGSVHAFVGENGAGKSPSARSSRVSSRPMTGQLVLRGEPVSFRLAARGARPRHRARRPGGRSRPAADGRGERLPGAEPRRFGFVRRRDPARSGSIASSPAPGSRSRPTRCVGALPLGQAAAGRDPPCARARSRAHRASTSRRRRSRPSRSRRFHEIVRGPRGQRPHGHPRLALPRTRSSSSPTRSRCCATARSSGPGRPPRDRGHARRGDARAVGRAEPIRPRSPAPADAPVALSVKDLRRAGVTGASLEVRAGEIVGLAGLVGAADRSSRGRSSGPCLPSPRNCRRPVTSPRCPATPSGRSGRRSR